MVVNLVLWMNDFIVLRLYILFCPQWVPDSKLIYPWYSKSLSHQGLFECSRNPTELNNDLNDWTQTQTHLQNEQKHHFTIGPNVQLANLQRTFRGPNQNKSKFLFFSSANHNLADVWERKNTWRWLWSLQQDLLLKARESVKWPERLPLAVFSNTYQTLLFER